MIIRSEIYTDDTYYAEVNMHGVTKFDPEDYVLRNNDLCTEIKSIPADPARSYESPRSTVEVPKNTPQRRFRWWSVIASAGVIFSAGWSLKSAESDAPHEIHPPESISGLPPDDDMSTYYGG